MHLRRQLPASHTSIYRIPRQRKEHGTLFNVLETFQATVSLLHECVSASTSAACTDDFYHQQHC